MRKMSTLLNYLFLICLVPSITFSQISSPQIDSLVAVALLKFKVAGAAVAVVKDGKVIHSKGYGLTDINSKKAVNEKTNFQIASNTKAFTTTALAIFEEKGSV